MTPEELLLHARAGDLAALEGHPDALSAAVRAFAERGDAASALELFARTWRMWLASGDALDVGMSLAEAALDAPGASAVPVWYARALCGDGLIAFRAGNGDRSRARNEQAVTVARKAGDVRGESDGLTGLARLALRAGDYDRVVSLAKQALDRARVARDREAEGAPLHLLAAGTRLQKNYETARDLYAQSIELSRELGNAQRIAQEHHNLGWVELHLGNVEAAAAHFRESDAAEAAEEYERAWRDLNWAAVALGRGDHDDAARRFVAGVRTIEKLGVKPDPDDQLELDWLRGRLEAAAC